MNIIHRKSWQIDERLATPEAVFVNRRKILAGLGAGMGLSAFGSGLNVSKAYADTGPADEDPSAGLYPVKRNQAYKLDRDLTPEEYNLKFNNYYEFGSQKQIAGPAQLLKIRPWEILIDGEVEKERTIAIDDLLKSMQLEERLYRHRCVEAWSMTVPWSGFALKDLVAFAKPNANAKYVRLETFLDKETASGQSQYWYPWPYVEGLSIQEANNDLAFMVTGAYGKPLAKQMGAPLRLALPWKYGFKSIKAIKRISFVTERPVSFWEEIAPKEYGFWANVNPEVPHRRWSQASETILHTEEKVPTLLFNGYAEQVASLYTDLEATEKLYY